MNFEQPPMGNTQNKPEQEQESESIKKARKIAEDTTIPESVVFETLGVDLENPEIKSTEEAEEILEKYKNHPDCTEFLAATKHLLDLREFRSAQIVSDYTKPGSSEHINAVELMIHLADRKDLSYFTSQLLETLEEDQKDRLAKKSATILQPEFQSAESFEDIQSILLICKDTQSALWSQVVNKGLSMTNNRDEVVWIAMNSRLGSAEQKEAIKKIAELTK